MRISDWSSDVCSSDLLKRAWLGDGLGICPPQALQFPKSAASNDFATSAFYGRSRYPYCPQVGLRLSLVPPGLAGLLKIGRASCREECVSPCRSRWPPYH